MEIKIKIKQTRKSKDMSLLELSKITKVSKSHLNYIERGLKEPTLSVLIKIAVALEVDERELYEVIF